MRLKDETQTLALNTYMRLKRLIYETQTLTYETQKLIYETQTLTFEPQRDSNTYLRKLHRSSEISNRD